MTQGVDPSGASSYLWHVRKGCLVQELRPGLYYLPVPTTFPIGPINTYLILGEIVTLVDTGPKHPEGLEVLRKNLREAAGLELADIDQVVLTHGHVDHLGMAGIIKDASGAPICAHPRERIRADGLPYFEALRDAYRDDLVAWGFDLPQLEPYLDRFPAIARFVDPIPVDRELHDGESLQMGDETFQVHHFPGHASGEIGLYHGGWEILISGDFLLPRITPNPVYDYDPERGERFRALPAHVASMAKAEALPDATVCPGHGVATERHHKLIRFNRRHHGLRKENILKMLRESPLTPREVMERLFPRLRPTDIYLAISETIGHIDLLEDENRVTVVRDDDGVIRYVAQAEG